MAKYFILFLIETILKTNILRRGVGESRNYSSIFCILIVVEGIYSAISFRRILGLDP